MRPYSGHSHACLHMLSSRSLCSTIGYQAQSWYNSAPSMHSGLPSEDEGMPGGAWQPSYSSGMEGSCQLGHGTTLGRNLPIDGLSTKTCQHAEYVNHNCLPSEWGMAACRVMMIAERSMTMYTLEELDSMCALPMSSFYISHPCFPIYWICSIMNLTRVVWEQWRS